MTSYLIKYRKTEDDNPTHRKTELGITDTWTQLKDCQNSFVLINVCFNSTSIKLGYIEHIIIKSKNL